MRKPWAGRRIPVLVPLKVHAEVLLITDASRGTKTST